MTSITFAFEFGLALAAAWGRDRRFLDQHKADYVRGGVMVFDFFCDLTREQAHALYPEVPFELICYVQDGYAVGIGAMERCEVVLSDAERLS